MVRVRWDGLGRFLPDAPNVTHNDSAVLDVSLSNLRYQPLRIQAEWDDLFSLLKERTAKPQSPALASTVFTARAQRASAGLT